MEEKIEKVVSGDVISPQLMFKPESAVKQGVILLRRADIEPDSPETVQGLQFRPCHMRIVIPQKAAVDGRQVSDKDSEHDGQPDSNWPDPRCARGCSRNRRARRGLGHNSGTGF